MADGSGTCYTYSGDKKIYESGLFEAGINVKRIEYCFRCDSPDSETLVFGKLNNDGSPVKEEDHAYLPCFGLSINHNIQANGEDHYSLSGTYTSQNWYPPAGVDGPFDGPTDLEYPYYRYSSNWAHSVNAFYNDEWKFLGMRAGIGNTYYYGNKKDK